MSELVLLISYWIEVVLQEASSCLVEFGNIFRNCVKH